MSTTLCTVLIFKLYYCNCSFSIYLFNFIKNTFQKTHFPIFITFYRFTVTSPVKTGGYFIRLLSQCNNFFLSSLQAVRHIFTFKKCSFLEKKGNSWLSTVSFSISYLFYYLFCRINSIVCCLILWIEIIIILTLL